MCHGCLDTGISVVDSDTCEFPPFSILDFFPVEGGPVKQLEVTSGANKIYFTCALIAVDTQPDTHDVDQSEIRTQILLATASSTLRSRSSFTHMLAEVRQPRRDQTPRALTFSRKKKTTTNPPQPPFKKTACVLSSRGNRAGVEAPASLTESAVASARSECEAARPVPPLAVDRKKKNPLTLTFDSFAVFCQTTCLTRIRTSRRPSAGCTVRTATCSCLPAKVNTTCSH